MTDMTHGTDPDKMTASARLDEVATLLAKGLVRMRTKERVSPDNSLGCPAENSPLVINLQRKG